MLPTCTNTGEEVRKTYMDKYLQFAHTLLPIFATTMIGDGTTTDSQISKAKPTCRRIGGHVFQCSMMLDVHPQCQVTLNGKIPKRKTDASFTGERQKSGLMSLMLG
eukprot:gene13182-3984_t